jgi:N-acetyl-anhydromuramoyl-L-alanine amidase
MHRFPNAIWVPSPHFDARPTNEVSLLVVHAIALPPGGVSPLPVLSFFQGELVPEADPYFQQIADLRVSAHCVIDRNGQIYQCVDFNQRAWHAGVSTYQGREACNDFSVGVELIGPEEGPFTESQIQALGSIARYLIAHYGLKVSNIVGHRDIAPGRKVDPGADFPYTMLRTLL